MASSVIPQNKPIWHSVAALGSKGASKTYNNIPNGFLIIRRDYTETTRVRQLWAIGADGNNLCLLIADNSTIVDATTVSKSGTSVTVTNVNASFSLNPSFYY